MGTQWISFIAMYSSKYWKIKINIPKSTHHYNTLVYIYFKPYNIVFSDLFISSLEEIFILRLGMYPFFLIFTSMANNSVLWEVLNGFIIHRKSMKWSNSNTSGNKSVCSYFWWNLYRLEIWYKSFLWYLQWNFNFINKITETIIHLDIMEAFRRIKYIPWFSNIAKYIKNKSTMYENL